MLDHWLKNFKNAWLTKNIDATMDLFTDDVEYWETPYQRLASKQELRREWGAVLVQENIILDMNVFSSTDCKHTVLWNLSYNLPGAKTRNCAGTYLIELNAEGLCSYFHQTGEVA